MTAGRQATERGFLRPPSIVMRRAAQFCMVVLALALIAPPQTHAQSVSNALTPDWCRQIPRPEYRVLARVHRSEPWFEIYRVAPGVFAIYEPHQFEEVISYLILGEKRALLFDTGMGIGDIKHVVESITPLPVAVMNSHTHNDHVGGNWQFSEIYGMDTEFTRTNARGSRDDAQAEVTRDALCGQWPAGFNPRAYVTRPWHVARWMHDGDTMDLGGRVLEVIATPGHTPDAVCLIDRKNGILFTGDTYYPAPIWLYRPETDLDAYAHSVERIAVLAPKLHVLFTAHNIPVAEPSQLPRLAKAFKKVRAGKVQPVTAGEGKVHYDVDGFEFLMAAPKSE